MGPGPSTILPSARRIRNGLMWREKSSPRATRSACARPLVLPLHFILMNRAGCCEIATDLPGSRIDEAGGYLGTALKLPPWLRSRKG